MKSEERHKLHENALAKWLIGVVESIAPYANAILAVVLLVVVVFGVLKWWQSQSVYAAAHAWDDLYSAVAANDTAALDRVVEQNPGTEVAYWAAVLSADMHLASGCQDLFTNKATAGQELRKAVEKCMKVRNESRTPVLRERATYGLARAYEALSGTRQSEGELNKAIQTYEEVVKNWPKGTYAGAAAKRLEDLQAAKTKVFYDKFAQHDPQPAFAPGGPGQPLFDSKSLPEGGDVPDFSKLMNEGAQTDKDAAKSATKEAKPAVEAAKPPAPDAKDAKTPAPTKEAKPAEKAPAKPEEKK